jgi:FlaA1/EpsC-like NDP-sugar epimerase
MDREKIKNLILQNRLAIIIPLHAAIIMAAFFLAFVSRLEIAFLHSAWYRELFLSSLPLLVALRLFSCWYFDLFRGLWRYVSVGDLVNIIKASLLGTLLFTLWVFIAFRGEGFPRSIFVLDFLYNILLMGGFRMAVRLFREKSGHLAFNNNDESRRRVLIVGAGKAGEMILREIRQNPRLGYNPVGLVDDDRAKQGSAIHGVTVLGPTESLAALARQHRIQEVIIAIPSAGAPTIRKIVQICRAAPVPSKTLPFISDMIDGRAPLSQIREVALEDLLGRNPVRLNMAQIGARLANQVVLVTGAAGSIGAELVRQVARFRPASIVLYERGENDLFHLEQDLKQELPEVAFTPIIGDIRDGERIRRVLAQQRPGFIFHAAAYKHVPLMEINPAEAVKNNIFGTKTLVTAAAEAGVENFILISSDKAVRPTNVMGATKRVAELIVQRQAKGLTRGARFLSVRFGNVLGSNGSVIPLFKKQIAAGGPVTVTHPEVRRYFMTVSEAAQLVLQAAVMGKGGEIFVLEMGEPVKISDLAENLIYLSGLTPGEEMPIVYTGLRPGEKLFEELLTATEGVTRTHHEKIWVLDDGRMLACDLLEAGLSELEAICRGRGEDEEIKAILQRLIPDYQPSGS